MSYDPKDLDTLREPMTKERFDEMVKEYEELRTVPDWREALPPGQRKAKRANGGKGLTIGSYKYKR